MAHDPFSDPAPIASEFASADSFRGRMVLIEPTGYELDVPNQHSPGQVSDRLTATVTVVDGKGPVQVFDNRVPTGKMLDGPAHKGVWFSQKRIVEGVCPGRQIQPGTKMLARLETYKPGKAAGLGNPWGLVKLTADEKAAAVKFLAELTINGASTPAEDEPPF